MPEENGEKETMTQIKISARLADILYIERGRNGSYTRVLDGWYEKVKAFDDLNKSYEDYKKESQAKYNLLAARLRKVKGLVKKSGNAELIAQMEAALKDQGDDTDGQ